MLFCTPKSLVGQRDVRSYSNFDPKIRAAYGEKINELLNLVHSDFQQRYYLSSDALEAFHSFEEELESKHGPGKEYQIISDFTLKLAGTSLRLAAVYQFGENAYQSEISLKTMEKSISLCKILIQHHLKALELVQEGKLVGKAKILLNWLVSVGEPVTKSMLHKAPGLNLKKQALDEVLEILADHCLVASYTLANKGGTKPTIYITVNPALL